MLSARQSSTDSVLCYSSIRCPAAVNRCSWT